MCESVENSPGTKALETMNTLHKDLVFKKPLGTARKKNKKILDDEMYVEVSVDYKIINIFLIFNLF